MTDTLIRRGTVARRLGLSDVSVGRLDAQLRPIRIDGERMYRADVVDRYAARRQINPPVPGRRPKEKR